jgi:aryl-alcohol dehydrogenase
MDFTAAVMHGDTKDMSFETVQINELRPDEVLVRLVATGVCHTDITVRDRVRDKMLPVTLPIILGHEGSGVVEKVGSAVTKVAAGDHVVLAFASCGHCPSCVDVEPAYCHAFGPLNFSGLREDGTSALSLGGKTVAAHFFGQSSFADYSVANQSNVVKVRKDAPLELLGPLGCGLQTGAGAILNSLSVRSGSALAVFGGGGVGLSAVMAAVLAGCKTIIVSEPNAERRKLALEVGATHVIDPMNTQDMTAKLQEVAGGPLDYAFDTTGIPAVIESAFAALAPRGAMGLVTMQRLDSALNIPIMAVLSGGKTLRGICEGDSVPDEFIPLLVDRFIEGKFPIDKLATFYKFEDLNKAIDDQEFGRAVKPIIRFS